MPPALPPRGASAGRGRNVAWPTDAAAAHLSRASMGCPMSQPISGALQGPPRRSRPRSSRSRAALRACCPPRMHACPAGSVLPVAALEPTRVSGLANVEGSTPWPRVTWLLPCAAICGAAQPCHLLSLSAGPPACSGASWSRWHTSTAAAHRRRRQCSRASRLSCPESATLAHRRPSRECCWHGMRARRKHRAPRLPEAWRLRCAAGWCPTRWRPCRMRRRPTPAGT